MHWHRHHQSIKTPAKRANDWTTDEALSQALENVDPANTAAVGGAANQCRLLEYGPAHLPRPGRCLCGTGRRSSADLHLQPADRIGSNCKPDPHSSAFAQRHAHTDPDAFPYTDINSDLDPYANTHQHRNPYAKSYGHSHLYAHASTTNARRHRAPGAGSDLDVSSH